MVDKRIVIQYTQGPHRGLWQLVGTESQMREHLQVTTLPDFVEPVQFLDHVGSASLINVRPRYVLYREISPPPTTYTFHPGQV